MRKEKLTKKEKRALAKEKKRRQYQQQLTYGRLKKIFVAAFGVFVIVFFGYKFINWLKTPIPEVAGEATQLNEKDWIKGNSQAQVVLIEYSDFQCPACAIYSALLKRLSEEYTDNLLIAFRHFPLTTIHKNAYSAAKAAESAGRQGKFWEMHDMLFEYQNDWEKDSNPKDKFVGYANELGLDEETFKKDFESQEIKDNVENDLMSANSMGLNSTPTFFLNGKKVQPTSFEGLKNLIEKEIENN